MGRKRVHSSQFSRKKQPAVKKKRENVDSLKKGTTRNVAVQAYNFLTDEKIDRLERECERLRSENANLKGTVQALRRSLGKCCLKKQWKCKRKV